MSEIQQWKDATKAREQRAREAIADCALQNRIEDVVAITHALSSLNPALEKLIAARKEWQQAVDALDQAAGVNHTKAPASRLRITILWEKTGRQIPSQVIDEPKAADSLARLLEQISRVLGGSIFPRLTTVRVGTAGLISRDPGREFLNPSTSTVYSHQAVGNTGWFVHTNGSTESKIGHIHQLAAILDLPKGTIEVQKILKQ